MEDKEEEAFKGGIFVGEATWIRKDKCAVTMNWLVGNYGRRTR